jgi:hypothetical protein
MRLTNFQQPSVKSRCDLQECGDTVSTRAVALSLRSHTSAWWSWHSKAVYLVPCNSSKASGSTWIRTIPRVAEGRGSRGYSPWQCSCGSVLPADVEWSKVHPTVVLRGILRMPTAPIQAGDECDLADNAFQNLRPTLLGTTISLGSANHDFCRLEDDMFGCPITWRA